MNWTGECDLQLSGLGSRKFQKFVLLKHFYFSLLFSCDSAVIYAVAMLGRNQMEASCLKKMTYTSRKVRRELYGRKAEALLMSGGGAEAAEEDAREEENVGWNLHLGGTADVRACGNAGIRRKVTE